jgi:hypothetical protein
MKIALVAASALLLCVVLLEVFLRYSEFIPDGYYIPRYYAGVPGDLEPSLVMREALFPERKYQITSTPQGTRGLRPFTPGKPDGTLRILCLGDSYTFSSGVSDEQTYPEQLAKELEFRYPERKFDVINAGVPLYGLLDEIDYYLEKGRLLRPDVVVLQFFPNDFQDHLRGTPLRESHRVLSKFSERSLGSRYLGWSKVYQWYAAASPMWNGVNHMNQSLPRKLAPCEGLDAALDPFRFCATQEESTFGADRDKLLGAADSPAFSRVVDAYFDALGKFRDILAKDGVQLLLVSIPDRWQVDGYRNAVCSVVAKGTSRYGIDAVDMMPVFRSSMFGSGINPFMTNGEDHCGPWGNRLVSMAVADALLVSRNPQQPTIRVRSSDHLFEYENPVRARLWVDKNSLLKPEIQDPKFAGVVVERAANLLVEEETSVPINVLKRISQDAGPGEILLRIDAKKPLQRFDMRFTRRLDNDPAALSSARALVSIDGVSWEQVDNVVSDKSGRSGSYEQFAIVEIPFKKYSPATVWLKIILQGTAALYSERPGAAKPERYFDLYLYPAAPLP